jgi:GNAT superfamily N-acetyltransferase
VYAVRVERDDETVGIGRIIGDGALFFEIVDMAVLPGHQGNGLGDAIMAALMGYLRGNARPGSFVGLFAGEGVSDFYEKYGFEARDEKFPGMHTVIP